MKIQNQKITPVHLARKAIVYLRQSSMKQVQENIESQRLQYALKDKARAFGFSDVEVIDCDLGASAALGSVGREGFKQLLASVALGEVGIVVSREVSRLSRTDKDWCHLLELCQAFDTLIADAEQVYDLSTMDDQLVLGIKGTLSVVELKVLKSRLLHGQEEKARRGELFRVVAPGYRHEGEGRITKDPDQRVQAAIQLVFTKFREIWSARQTHKWFHENNICLPVNRRGNGRITMTWQLPAQSFIKSILHNPIYAGAYVYGQRPKKMVLVDGRIVKRNDIRLKPEECRVFIRDHHDGYIDWKEFEENQKMLRSNALKLGSDASVSVIRKGHGLLSGLLRCGRCGRKLHVRYWGKSGTAARYLCSGDFQSGGSYCMGFGGATVDRRFSELLVEVISPHGLEASLRAVKTLNSKLDGKLVLLRQQVEQLEYEARRAFEQYNEVDPRNRLVAAELERRWNQKLAEVDQAKKALQGTDAREQTLTSEQESQILQMGSCFKDVWESELCPIEKKKKIFRTVMDEVVVTLDDASGVLQFIIHWKGGCHTELKMDKPRSGVGKATDIQDIDLIRKMADRYEDGEIARVLNKQKRKTGKGLDWSQSRVASARKAHGIAGACSSKRRAQNVLSLAQAAEHCGVSDTTIRKLVDAKILPMTQLAPWAPWEILREDLDSSPIRSALEYLRITGKLVLDGIVSECQPTLFQ
jgi:DNA invertase Pin-like site-specific DNA recombinase